MDSTENPGPDLRQPASPPRWHLTAVCLGLTALVFAVFGRSIHYDFVSYDDPSYVYQNLAITRGLTLSGIGWLFTHSNVGTWFPVTDISHQFDWQLYGSNAGGHHLTNVVLHAATTVLLFLALNRLTRRFWPAAVVAAIFALHPLRVESVAWVVERKDVLSGLFFTLALWAWAGHVEKLGLPDNASRPVWRFTSHYWMALLFFALGLMSKSMLVTWPAVLLLLDYWPSNRFTGRPWLRTSLGLIAEKLPFFALAVVSAVITVLTGQNAVTIARSSTYFSRAANALVAYVDYLGHMIWPVDLTVVYAHPPAGPPLYQVALAAALMLVVSAAALVWHKKRPWLMVGWLWYLGMFLPVIDVMQAGYNARADRYTYLPQIGFCLILVWGAIDLSASWRHRRLVRMIAAATVIFILSVASYIQTGCWKDSASLWTHALACRSDHAYVHNAFGVFLLNTGKTAEAAPHFRQSLELEPDNPDAHVNLGIILAGQDDRSTALWHFNQALQLDPYSSQAHYHLGDTLLALGKTDDAIVQFQTALKCNPNLTAAHYDWGLALATQDKWDEAISEYEQALSFKLDRTDARYITAVALATQQKWDAAIALDGQVLQARPDYAEAHNQLGIALAAQGKTTDAKAQFQQALALAKSQGNSSLAESIRLRLESSPTNSISKPLP